MPYEDATNRATHALRRGSTVAHWPAPVGSFAILAVWTLDDCGAVYALHRVADGVFHDEILIGTRRDAGWDVFMSGGQDDATSLVAGRDTCWDGRHWEVWPHSMTAHPVTGGLIQVVYGATCRHIVDVGWSVGNGPSHHAVIEAHTGVFLLGALAPHGQLINITANSAEPLPGIGTILRESIPTDHWSELS